MTPALQAVPEGAICVPLSKEDRDKAEWNGHAIFKFNRVDNDVRQAPLHESRNYKETGALFETKSQAAEIAVANYLGYPEAYIGFTPYPEEFHRPDLLDIVEVRRVLHPCNPLTVFSKDVTADAIAVKTYYETGNVYIVGWEYATTAWQLGTYAGTDARQRHTLQPASTFLDAVLSRLKEMWTV